MRIAFPGALILLLFAFSTKHHLTLAESNPVKDTKGYSLVPGNLYHIVDFANHARKIEVGETQWERCPVSVTIGLDGKNVIIRPHRDAQSINVGESVTFEFEQVEPCAVSAFWNVSIHRGKQYPLVIGPPKGTKTMVGTFRIIKADGGQNAYYIAFGFGVDDDYALVESTSKPSQDIYSLVFCTHKQYQNFTVAFEPQSYPSPPPPSPSPPPPSPSPPPPPSPSPPPPPSPSPPPPAAPTSTFVPLIRKIVR